MMQKLAAAGAGAALLLGTAVPAFADFDDVSAVAVINWAEIQNNVLTVSNSGLNVIVAGEDVEGGSITSGTSIATSQVTNLVNTNDVSSCGCVGLGGGDDLSLVLVGNYGNVQNNVGTLSNSGLNIIAAQDDVEGGSITSGAAGAGSVVSNVVNTNLVN